MAHPVFILRQEFSKGFSEGGVIEDGVVAKSIAASFFEGYKTLLHFP